ncbi:DUF664 domain-containing protein [Amycolatopsis sp. NPDC059021]|uniref:mycothiol transferase n=1 Tax=Amycolatopsis sp. NPDC059021 TaxID=3346704 RepID=UPI003670DBB7
MSRRSTCVAICAVPRAPAPTGRPRTINALAIDAPGHVPWWPRPAVMLFNVLVHMLTETSRHAGHADILREQLDRSTGATAHFATQQHDTAFWDARRAKIEQAATAAAAKLDHDQL